MWFIGLQERDGLNGSGKSCDKKREAMAHLCDVVDSRRVDRRRLQGGNMGVFSKFLGSLAYGRVEIPISGR